MNPDTLPGPVVEAAARFDRWLAAHDAKVKAEALREAADVWAADPDDVGDTDADARNWLRDRAARLAGGDA